MSWRVTEVVVDQSGAKHGARTMLLVLAEKASTDGVALIRQAPPKSPRRALRGHERNNLVARTNLSVKQIQRVTRTLQHLDELEVLERWIGRDRDFVYRILVGPLRSMDVDYEQLKFSGLTGRFWTPEELLDPISARPRDGHVLPEELLSPGDKLSPGQNGDEATSCPPTRRHPVPDQATSCPDPLLRSARARRPEDPSKGPSSTSSVKTTEEVSSGEPADASRGQRIKELIIAFAETVGVFPGNRDEWGGWSAAFAPLVDRDVDPDRLRALTRRYLDRWPGYDPTPFALTKLLFLLEPALDANEHSLWRWAADTSWKLPAEDAELVLEWALITDQQRAGLRKLAGDARAAHANREAELMRWVETEGFAVDDDVWRRELAERVPHLKTRGPAARKQANERRAQLRGALARIQLGEQAA